MVNVSNGLLSMAHHIGALRKMCIVGLHMVQSNDYTLGSHGDVN